MSGKGRRAYNKAPTKEKLRKWGSLSREGDKIKFVDGRLKRWQIVGFRDSSGWQWVLQLRSSRNERWAIQQFISRDNINTASFLLVWLFNLGLGEGKGPRWHRSKVTNSLMSLIISELTFTPRNFKVAPKRGNISVKVLTSYV